METGCVPGVGVAVGGVVGVAVGPVVGVAVGGVVAVAVGAVVGVLVGLPGVAVGVGPFVKVNTKDFAEVTAMLPDLARMRLFPALNQPLLAASKLA